MAHLTLPIKPCTDKETVTCMVCKETNCDYQVTIFTPGKRFYSGLHSKCYKFHEERSRWITEDPEIEDNNQIDFDSYEDWHERFRQDLRDKQKNIEQAFADLVISEESWSSSFIQFVPGVSSSTATISLGDAISLAGDKENETE